MEYILALSPGYWSDVTAFCTQFTGQHLLKSKKEALLTGLRQWSRRQHGHNLCFLLLKLNTNLCVFSVPA